MNRPLKYFLSLIPLLILSLLAVGIYFIPWMLSSAYGIRYLEKHLTKKLGKEVLIGSMNIHWSGKQNILNIKMQGTKDLIEIGSFSFDCPLLSLIFPPENPILMLSCGDLEIKNFTYTHNKRFQLERILGKAIDNNDFSILAETKKGKKNGSLLAEISLLNLPTCQITMHSFPSDILACLHPQIPADLIIGPYCNGECELSFGDKSTNWSIHAGGTYLKVTGSGVFHKAIELITPLRVDFILTKELSQILFKELSFQPISASAMHLEIAPEGTFIPLQLSSFNALNIPSLHLDLGKVHCKNLKTLSVLLSMIELRPRFSSDILIWFQEAPIKIEKGIAFLPRTEMLIDNAYQIGVWGEIDLIKQRVDGKIAVPALTLQRGFGFKQIPPDYSVVLKIDGPFNDLYIHKSKALQRLAALAIIDQSPIKLLPKSEKVPSIRYPLPWKR